MDALLAVVGAVAAFVGWFVGLAAGARRQRRRTMPELPSLVCLACGGEWNAWSRTTHMTTTDGGASVYYQQRDCKDCGLLERRRVPNP